MPAQAPPRTPLEKWQDGVSKARTGRTWDAYDCEIRMAVGEFNSHLRDTAGYSPLDWKLIKAMVWTESGPTSREWKTKPMQIGVVGDPGLASLLSGQEGGELVLPPGWQTRLTPGTVRTIPAHNLRAGIGYLLMRMANFEFQSVPNEDDPGIHQVVVQAGDTMVKIAKAHGSTTDILRKLNPNAAILRSGQTLQYQKGSIKRVITGWRPITTAAIAQRYNGGGDVNYARKLDYALSLIRKGKETTCP